MEDELTSSLASSVVSTRKGALAEMAKEGEAGAMSMGYHESAASALEDFEPEVQAAALAALGAMGKCGLSYGDAIAAKLGSSEPTVKRAAVQAFGDLGESASAYVSAVEGCLESSDLDLVAAACVALGSMKAMAAAPKLKAMIADHADQEVVLGAISGLGAMGAEAGALSTCLSSKEPRFRAAAAAGFATSTDMAEPYAVQLATMVGDSDCYVRLNAASAICALGAKAATAAATLKGLLGNADAGVMAAAASALGGIGPSAADAADALEGLLNETGEDTSSFMLTIAGQQSKTPATLRKPACAAAAALAKIGASAALPKLAAGFNSPDYEVRKECAAALGAMGEESAKFEEALMGLLEDSQPVVAATACKSLGRIAKVSGSSASVADKMAESLKSSHPGLKSSALEGLGEMGEDGVRFIDEYIKCFSDPCGIVRASAIKAITGCGEVGQMYASEVCRMMFDGDSKVRVAALSSLPKMGERGAAFAEEVCALLGDTLPEVRLACLQTLGAFGPENYEPFIDNIMYVADTDDALEVREAAKAVVSGKAAIGE